MKKLISAMLAAVLLLGNYKGYVALYQSGESEPIQVYPYPVHTLPEADQSALSRGIPIYSESELAHRLEDFLS